MAFVQHLQFYWHMVWRGGYRMSIIVWGLVSSYDTVSAQLFPDSRLPTVGKIISWWDWKVWLIILLVIMVVAISETAYHWLRPIKNRRTITNKLSTQFEEVTALMNTEIGNEADYGAWKHKVDNWQSKTNEVVTQECSKAELTLFKSVAGAKKTRWKFGFNPEHNDILTVLDQHRTNLEKLITRYLEESK